jgi:hypothetical protein
MERIESPEIDPNAYGDLVYGNDGILNQWGKDMLFCRDLGTSGQTFGKYIAGSLPGFFPQNKVHMAQRLENVMEFYKY